MVFQGYRLDFYQPLGEPTIWNGSSATVIEDEKHTIWGAVYEIDLMHLASLDIQEGVHIDKYIPLIKEVVTPDGEVLECRLYQMLNVPTNSINLSDSNIPYERKPSKCNANVVIFFQNSFLYLICVSIQLNRPSQCDYFEMILMPSNAHICITN